MVMTFLDHLTVDERADCLEFGQLGKRDPRSLVIAPGARAGTLFVVLSWRDPTRMRGTRPASAIARDSGLRFRRTSLAMAPAIHMTWLICKPYLSPGNECDSMSKDNAAERKPIDFRSVSFPTTCRSPVRAPATDA